MTLRTSTEIRQQFLDFFRSKQHEIVPSSSVVPHDDPTLLFTNAGMNQFKDVFLGTGSRAYTRAADTQKCIRAGGKHNDLDDVGKDTYHHTFFEMLGNWSFGDYFKEEAISWAWELLTEVWGLEKDRLYATFFEGDPSEDLAPDEEARRLWAEKAGLDPSHIVPGNKKDNFWEMGDTGPCGPCSEIHIDLTPDKSGGHLVNQGDPRVIEIWNLVFIQYNRGSDGKLNLLPAKHVDTGMGFERVTAVLQGKTSNYDSDVFAPLFDAIQKRSGAAPYGGRLPKSGERGGDPETLVDTSYRVIGDHVRTLTFALTDGAVISNEGRGYVLRRILRRAVRYGRQYMGMTDPFLADLVDALVDQMEPAFPELRAARQGRNVEHVKDVLREEEESFGRTLDRGIKLFQEAANVAVTHASMKVSGEDAFRLHDTYGFPIDLTELMAEERGLTVDIGEYERLMEEARERARSGGTERTGFDLNIVDPMPSTNDAPKYDAKPTEAKLLGFVQDGRFHASGSVPRETSVGLVLGRTPFYGEQGGQVGDRGWIRLAETGVDGADHGGGSGAGDGSSGGRKAGFRVHDTQRFGDTVIHIGELEPGSLDFQVDAIVIASVDESGRAQIMRNHTTTHLLNWALRDVLGDEIHQRGSLLDTEKTRFDFSHGKPISTDELVAIETGVQKGIAAGLPVYAKEVPQAEAREVHSLRAVFGEKYPDVVRVVSVGVPVEDLLASPADEKWMAYSVEFCGGTHLATTADARSFALLSEEGVAKGVRRVVGVTGDLAVNAHEAGKKLEADLAAARGITGDAQKASLQEIQTALQETAVPVYVKQRILAEMTTLHKELRKAEKAQAAESGDAVMDVAATLLGSAPSVSGVSIVVGQVPEAPVDALRGAVDWIRDKSGGAAVLLLSASEDKVTLLAAMSKGALDKGVKAGDLIKEIAPLVGGRGGGRPDMAQGGGSDVSGIPGAIERAKTWLSERLG